METQRSVSITENTSRRIGQATLLLGRAASLCTLTLLSLSFSCKETPPEPPKPATISLKAEDASCTEAWLKASASQFPTTVRLLRLDPTPQTRQTLRLTTADTLLIDEGLLPRRTYTYQLQKLTNDSGIVETSVAVQLTTMDTTSHAFQWTLDSVGTETSILRDVAFVGDEIWTVGTINVMDSLGQLQRYNLAKWNRQGLQLLRVQFSTICGQSSTTPYPAKSIFAFNATDIWIAMYGDQVARWNGTSQVATMCMPLSFSINKLWGHDPAALYAVGDNGNVFRFDGTIWRRIESGTNVELTDVWGSPDGSVVWACGWKDFQPTVLLKIVSGVCEKVYEDQTHLFSYRSDSLSGAIRSVWTNRNDKVYALSWYDLYDAPVSTHGEARARWRGNPLTWVDWRIRGNAINDLVAAGYEARIWHFNGVAWKRFDNLVNPLDELLSVAIKDNMIVAVGWRYYNGIENFGIIYRGRR